MSEVTFEMNSIDEIMGYAQREIDAVKEILISNFLKIGEEAVNTAREFGEYIDDTGNLRSSTGCILLVDGIIVGESGFEPVKESGKEGAEQGRAYARKIAEELAIKYPTHIVLIVVAGKEYAEYVSDTGRDVLDSAEIVVEEKVHNLQHTLLNKLRNRYRSL